MFDKNGFDMSKWNIPVELQVDLGDLLVLYGLLSLALRHPGNPGPLSERGRRFVNVLEEILFAKGMLNEKVLSLIKKDEQEARGRS